jgi:hypothetical protein
LFKFAPPTGAALETISGGSIVAQPLLDGIYLLIAQGTVRPERRDANRN